MSWLLAFVGFGLLIVLHELGHFWAAKSVGMRVERFSLFFPPHITSIRRGETEYSIGAVPLGGYVKITGMSREEEVPPEHEARAYYNQAIWKRVVVIAAGPAMNILVAFVLLVAFFGLLGLSQATPVIGEKDALFGASKQLQVGDRIVAVDGKPGTTREFSERVAAHKCDGKLTDGCKAATPAVVVVERNGREVELSLTPQFDTQAERMRLGVRFAEDRRALAPVSAVDASLDEMWFLTKRTVSLPARIFDAEKRKEISSVVGAYEQTRQTIKFDVERAVAILALISLSIAIINLFPFLPLDGGHIFWALAEGMTGRPIPARVIERASMVGFALVIGLFVVGFTNDIDRFRNGGFGP